MQLVNFITVFCAVIAILLAIANTNIGDKLSNKLLYDVSQATWDKMREEGNKQYAPHVVIKRDEYGVPHVYGKRNIHTVFGLAYAHSEDDFITIQQVLFASRGKLAEVYGRKHQAPANDYLNYFLRVKHHVDTKYQLLGEDVKQICEAYAKGVNYYAALHREEVLAGWMFPIKAEDVVAGFVHKVPFMFKFELLVNYLLNSHDAATARSELKLRNYFNSDESSKPSAKSNEHEQVDSNESNEHLLSSKGSMGSNTFAVSSKKAADKQSTMFVANSHQPWEGAASWYEAHVHSEDDNWNLLGSLLPGAPYPNMGINERFGWAHTVNRPDIVDIYELTINENDDRQYLLDGKWKHMEVTQAPITVKLLGPFYWTFTKEIEHTVHGPVIRAPSGASYALRYATAGSVMYVQQGYYASIATSFDEWKSAMSMEGRMPMFNANYADHNDTIFYVWNGAVPQRNPNYNYDGVVIGNTSDTLWNTYHPFEDMPQILNPTSAFTQSCNNCPFNSTIDVCLDTKERCQNNPITSNYDHTWGIEPELTNRALQALHLFAADDAVTFDEFIQYKFDMFYHNNSFAMNQIRRLSNWKKKQQPNSISATISEAIDHLEQWDGATHKDNKYCALAMLTLAPFVDTTLWVFGPYPTEGIADINNLLMKLNSSAILLKKQFNTLSVEWGEVHRMIRGNNNQLNIPIGGGPDVLYAIYSKPMQKNDSTILKGFAGEGSLQIVRWYSDVNATTKKEKFEGFILHQFGNSHRTQSKHYVDQAQLMANRSLRPIWLTEQQINEHLLCEYNPGLQQCYY